jgi:hypothetical protein
VFEFKGNAFKAFEKRGNRAMTKLAPDLTTENSLKVLDFAEKQGLENIRFRLQNSEALAKEVNTTLTVLLSALGVSMSYAVTSLRAGSLDVSAWVAVVLAGWLVVVGALLIKQCLLSRDLPVPTNEPENLLQFDWIFEDLRRGELLNLQERISQVIERNHRTAAWLDRIRILMLCSFPIGLVAAAAFFSER